MADPFKRAVSRTLLKRDEQGPYYDVNVSGGGGDAPEPDVQEDAPTVLDMNQAYGPPLPPGSVGYGDEEGPIPDYEPDSDEDDMSSSMPLSGPVLAQNEDPTLLQRIRQWFTAPRGDESASRDVAEGINEALPSDLSGREAVLKKREQLRKLDRQTEET